MPSLLHCRRLITNRPGLGQGRHWGGSVRGCRRTVGPCADRSRGKPLKPVGGRRLGFARARRPLLIVWLRPLTDLAGTQPLSALGWEPCRSLVQLPGWKPVPRRAWPLLTVACRGRPSGSLASGCAIIGSLGRRGDDVTAAEGSAAPAERCGAAIALTAEPLSERPGSPGCPGRAGRG